MMNVGQREREFFDRFYETTNRIRKVWPIQPEPQGDWIDFSMRLFGNVAGKKLIDFGCGQGYCSVKMALSGAQVLGVDASSVGVDATLALAAQMGCRDRVEAKMMLVEDLTHLPAGSFDGIFGSLILHHLPDMKGTGLLCNKLLKPGCRAVFCENSDRNSLVQWARTALHGKLGFKRDGTDDERRLSSHDIDVFASPWAAVKIHYPQFTFFHELARTGPFKGNTSRKVLKSCDRFVQKRVPVLRPYGVLQVVEFIKKN